VQASQAQNHPKKEAEKDLKRRRKG